MIPLKQFVYDEAERLGVHPTTIRNNIHRGHYPSLKIERKNKRVVMVEPALPKKHFRCFVCPHCGHLKHRPGRCTKCYRTPFV